MFIATALITACLSATEAQSPADAVVSAAFNQNIDTTKASQQPQSTEFVPGTSTVVTPLLAIVGLGVFAFTLRRRKKTIGGQGIALLEAASLGEKRSLVIADVLGERLVLAVSEAGISVLMSKPAPALNENDTIVLPPPALASPSAKPMGFFARLTGKHPAPTFDSALQESVEDQELRAKLAAGIRGVIP